MSASEFMEWQAFERVEGPIGGRRGDLQAAIVAYYTALPNIESHQREDITISDFMPQFDRADEQEMTSLIDPPEEGDDFYG